MFQTVDVLGQKVDVLVVDVLEVDQMGRPGYFQLHTLLKLIALHDFQTVHPAGRVATLPGIEITSAGFIFNLNVTEIDRNPTYIWLCSWRNILLFQNSKTIYNKTTNYLIFNLLLLKICSCDAITFQT